jgi:hypothetical protein
MAKYDRRLPIAKLIDRACYVLAQGLVEDIFIGVDAATSDYDIEGDWPEGLVERED